MHKSNLHVRDEGDGTPLLLLHAFPVHGESFGPLMAELAPEMRLLVPDQRGFGESPPCPSVLTMESLADDALAILDERNIESAVVGGVSMGGYVSMALLRKAPERVRRLVLIDTHAFADDEAGKAGREKTARAILEHGPSVLIENLLPKLLSPSVDPSVRARVASMILECPPATAAAALRGMALRPDSHETLARWGGPVLIVVGEDDTLAPLERARAMVDVLPGAQLVTVPAAGHLSPLEAPASVARAIRAFV
jgi:pimeloyl-ACP methyl ester carboxylesterase